MATSLDGVLSLVLLLSAVKFKTQPSPWGPFVLETWADWFIVALEMCGAASRLLDGIGVDGYEDPWAFAAGLVYLPVLLRCSLSIVCAHDYPGSLTCRLIAVFLPGSLVSRVCFASSALLHILFGAGKQGHLALQGKAPKSKLKILVLTIGTRGDVQPFVALGQELQRRGHFVSICAFDTHKELVLRHGLTFASAGLDGIEQDALSWRRASHVSEVMKYSLPDFTRNFVHLGKHFFKAAQGMDVLVSVSTTQSFAFSIAEKLEIPVWVVKLAPDSPTRAFPPPNYSPSWLGIVNYLKWVHHWLLVALAARSAKMGPSEDEFRQAVLGLKPLQGGKRIHEMFSTPTLCAFSPTVVPTPRDWGGNSISSGWFYASQAQPSDGRKGLLYAALDDFLGTENDVLCITFGSMFPAADGAKMVELVIEAALLQFSRRPKAALTNGNGRYPVAADLRVLVIRPPGQGHAYAIPSNVAFFEVGEAPHNLVFPRCRLVVHHGGAGTTASVLESGTPAIVIPILLWTDQPLWAERLESLGCALRIKQTLLQADGEEETKVCQAQFINDVARALDAAPALRRCCEEMAKRLVNERGVELAADYISLG